MSRGRGAPDHPRAYDGTTNERLTAQTLTTVVPYQSDLALNAVASFLIAVLYFASQQTLLPLRWSCTRTGTVSGSVGRWRFGPLPFA